MATFRLRRFSHPETLQAIAPERLLAFLHRYEPYFTSRGLKLPPAHEPGSINLDQLIKILLRPNATTPPALIDALAMIDELSTSEGMDALLEEVQLRGLQLELEPNASPADVAVAVWLKDPDAVEKRHAEQDLRRRRSFTCFQTTSQRVVNLSDIPEETLHGLEQSLDDWFEARQRGRGTRVLVFAKEKETWFLVRHGEPIKREGSLDFNGKETQAICYRPLRYDLVIYQPTIKEIRINAKTKTERDLYRREFGRHLFGSANYFPGTAKFTLLPLRNDGLAALNVIDVEGIDWIRLIGIHFYHDETGLSHIYEADDLLLFCTEQDEDIFNQGRMVQAKFLVKFSDAKSPRSVVIRPSNIAQYTRDEDSVYVEDWLSKRGFMLSPEVNHVSTLLATA